MITVEMYPDVVFREEGGIFVYLRIALAETFPQEPIVFPYHFPSI